jgi:uncharacterized membrane protein YeaQ/YmgE (transglycosylase-associated protein family)
MDSRWNPLRAMIWGACIGALVATFDLVGHWDLSEAASQLGQIAGSVIGGAILFGLATVIRNWVRKV